MEYFGSWKIKWPEKSHCQESKNRTDSQLGSSICKEHMAGLHNFGNWICLLLPSFISEYRKAWSLYPPLIFFLTEKAGDVLIILLTSLKCSPVLVKQYFGKKNIVLLGRFGGWRKSYLCEIFSLGFFPQSSGLKTWFKDCFITSPRWTNVPNQIGSLSESIEWNWIPPNQYGSFIQLLYSTCTKTSLS